MADQNNANTGSVQLPEPQSRVESMLYHAATGEGDIPDNQINRKEIYLKAIIDRLDDIGGVEFRKVEELPETGEDGVIYLVPNEQTEEDNIYDEYIWTDNAWEKIGTTAVPLSDYYTKDETDALLLAKQDALTFNSAYDPDTNKAATMADIQSAIGDAMEGGY